MTLNSGDKMALKDSVGKPKCVFIPDDLEYDTDLFLIPSCYKDDLKALIISEGLIKDRIRKLAREIHERVGDQPLFLLCVLKGSYRFFTELVDELTITRSICETPMTVDFVRAMSYEDTETTGKVQLVGLSNLDEIKGQNILIVDDIVDSGLTLSRIIHTIKELGALRIWSCLMLSKRVNRRIESQEDFVAFNIPDKFIVGYGLDYNQKFRDLNHICVMSPSGIAKYKLAS